MAGEVILRLQRLVAVCVGAAILVGCGDPPKASAPQPTPKPPEDIPSTEPAPKVAPTSTPPGKAEPVSAVDLAKYGIRAYPNSKAVTDANLSFTSPEGREFLVTYETVDTVRAVANFFRDQVKADEGLLSGDIALIQGTSSTGNPVKISIGQVDGKTNIAITVGEKPAK